MVFDLHLLTWISIGIIYSSRNITYQVWNFWDRAFIDLWPTDLNINRDHLHIKDYLPTKSEALEQSTLELSVSPVVGDKHDFRHSPLTFCPEYQLESSTYHGLSLPTKFEASEAKRSWVINRTRCERPTWPLTWISKGIIYSSSSIYLPSMKLLELSLHMVWETKVISCTRWT